MAELQTRSPPPLQKRFEVRKFHSRAPKLMASLLYAIAAAPNLFLLNAPSSPLDLSARQTAAVASVAALAILYSMHRRLPRLTTIILVPLACLGGIELAFAMQFGTLVDENALSLIAETNRAEFGDLLQSLPTAALLSPLAILLMGALAIANPYRPGRSKFRLLGLAGPLALVVAFATTLTPPEVVSADLFMQANEFPAPPSDQERAIRSSFPTGLPLVISDFQKQRHALAEAYERNRTFTFGVKMHPLGSSRKIFVLVIGETSRADHWSINGYARQTTSLLEARPNIVSFPNMFSFSTFSRLAVPVLISRKPAASNEQIFHEASIVTAFKEAGFATTWISMQAPVGFHESPISVHAYEADKTIFLNPVDYRSSGKHDTAALPVISDLIHRDRRDIFVVLHTLGSHYRYVDRYPRASAKFLPDRHEDRKEGLFNAADKEVLVNSYDNSIVETDKLLDGVIALLSAQDAESWMFYSSDHGEALFDDCRMHSGHGQSSLATHSVASVFWPSNAFLENNRSLVDVMRAKANRKLSTSMVFATLSSLGALNVPGNKASLDMTSAVLETPPEILGLNLSPPQNCK